MKNIAAYAIFTRLIVVLSAFFVSGCANIGTSIGLSLPVGNIGGVGVSIGSDGRIGGSVGVGAGGGSVSVGTSGQLPAKKPDEEKKPTEEVKP
jgi:hypothetical protein